MGAGPGTGLVFQRYELKYLMTPEQYRAALEEVRARMRADAHGESTVQSLYYDTDDFRIVRRSMEGPVYKEKLRLRCYGLSDGLQPVFLEMKRKYDGIVYKRRAVLTEAEAAAFFAPDGTPGCSSGGSPRQIERELTYFISRYEGLSPRILLLYDRTAFCDPLSDLRVTFDRKIRYRTSRLDLSSSLRGVPLLPEETVLMEVKTAAALPLWLCSLLSRERIRKTAFSKYGSAYQAELARPGCGGLNLIIGGTEACLKPSFPMSAEA